MPPAIQIRDHVGQNSLKIQCPGGHVSYAELKDVEDFYRSMAAEEVRNAERLRILQAGRRITYMVLLASAFLIYYLLDKAAEALTLL